MTVEKSVVEQAQESLAQMLADDAAILEADWINQGSPIDADGAKQYRGLAQVLAELHEAEEG